MRHIIPISGKDSACTAIVQIKTKPRRKYELIFNATGAELPPVYDWLARVAKHLRREIKVIGADLEEIIYDQGILPSVTTRFCTRLAKIVPMEKYLEGTARVYYGLRADEPERVGYVQQRKKSRIQAEYPLREAGINLPMVWRILEERNLLTPFFEWKSMGELVKAELGDEFDELVAQLHPWEYRHLFSWRVREFNCSYCFFMRQYEFVGLYEYWPEHFWRAVAIEEDMGSAGYTLLRGKSLREIVANADAIRARRAKEVVSILRKRQSLGFADELSATSCGVFCGK